MKSNGAERPHFSSNDIKQHDKLKLDMISHVPDIEHIKSDQDEPIVVFDEDDRYPGQIVVFGDDPNNRPAVR